MASGSLVNSAFTYRHKTHDTFAVTYIFKVAAEMQTRLNARLFEMDQCPESELIYRLSEIDVSINDDFLKRAQL